MKKSIVSILLISSFLMVACDGGSTSNDPSADTPVDPVSDSEAQECYNLFAPVAKFYEIDSKQDLINRLIFFDEYNEVVGSTSPSTISNLINNSSAISEFYTTWNSAIGTTTVTDFNNYKNFYNTWNPIVGSYTPGQITQFISGALVINGKKEFINDLLHGIGSWNKSSMITYGFTTNNPKDIQVNIVNRSNYQVINNAVTKQTNGFTINLSAVPAGTYIVTVSGYYVIAGVSMQETETGCFVFSR